MADREMDIAASSSSPGESDNQSGTESSSWAPGSSDSDLSNEFILNGMNNTIFELSRQINNIDDFRRRDVLFRTNQTARAVMIEEMARFIGGTLTQTTVTLMRWLSDDVMAQFNFTGSDGMENFSATEIYLMLREAIMRASGAQESEVEAAMKEHLRQAPDRVGGGGRQNAPN